MTRIPRVDALLRAAFERSPIGMVLVDAEGTMILVNARTEKLFGYAREELIGNGIELLVPPRFRDNHPGFRRSYFEAPSARPMGASRDLSGLRKDGSEFPIEIGLNPVQTEDGLCVLSTIADITERKRSEGLFRVAVESSPSAVVMVDRAGRIVLVNAKTEELFGYTRQELVGQPVDMLVPIRFRNVHPTYRHGYFESPDARPMGAGRDLFGLRKDGSEFPVEIGLNPISTEDDSFVLSAIVDITERKRGEERLRAAAEELARSNAELAQFAYVASHDLQEPLRMVASYVQLLDRQLEDQLDDEGRGYVAYAVDGVKRMQALIRDLLEYSRVGTRGGELRETDLNVVAREALDNLRVTIGETGAEVELCELPVIEADPAQLVRLLQNLVGNAIKFRGERTPHVRISAREVASSCEIEVADNGIGIEPRFSERIFGVFQRLHTGEHPGTGIGLAICKKIAERHGGSIRVESEPNRGARFYVKLPLRKNRWK